MKKKTLNELNSAVVDVLVQYIDRMNDPLETAEYMLTLLEKFTDEVNPVLDQIVSIHYARAKALEGRTAPEEYRGTRIHSIWAGMLERCLQSNSTGHEYYGGKGVSVSDEWLDFMIFYADMGDPPDADYSLDRIDSNGDYCASNCRWANKSTQMRNRKKFGRSSTYKGVSFRKKQGIWIASSPSAGGGKKQNYIGCYQSEIEAAKAVRAFLIKNGPFEGWSAEDYPS